MAEVKATAVCYLKSKLRERGGDAEKTLLARLPPATARDYIEALPLSWLPIESAATIDEQGAPLLFPGHPAPIRELGHQTAMAGYRGIYRMLLRVTTIPFVLDHAARLWRNHHTEGQISAVLTTAREVTVTVINYSTLNEPIRELVAGYFTALCCLTGASKAHVKRDDDPPVWKWIVTWNDR